MDTDIDWSAVDDTFDSNLSATLRSSNGGGGTPAIEQTTDHPRVAELTILQAAYDAVRKTGVSIRQIKSQLAELRAEEDNYWRTDDGWQGVDDFDVETLPDSKDLGAANKEFPTVAFDITDEGVAGYDVLDLTGWAVRCASTESISSEGVDLETYRDAETLSPVPVEVKSINSSNPSFKFSLNQHRRAYEFVTPVGSDATVPYVLFLVEVSTDDSVESEPQYSVEPCEVIVITCPADLRQLLPSDISPNENDTVIDDLILRVLRWGDLIIGGLRS